jgi:hypothetical protein
MWSNEDEQGGQRGKIVRHGNAIRARESANGTNTRWEGEAKNRRPEKQSRRGVAPVLGNLVGSEVRAAGSSCRDFLAHGYIRLFLVFAYFVGSKKH